MFLLFKEGRLVAHLDVWRYGLQPQLNDACLRALRQGLVDDDKRLCQGYTTIPSVAMNGHADRHAPTAADPLAYALWRGLDLQTVGQIAQHYEECANTARLAGHQIAQWQEWCDRAGRDEMVQVLLAEVEAELQRRADNNSTWLHMKIA